MPTGSKETRETSMNRLAGDELCDVIPQRSGLNPAVETSSCTLNWLFCRLSPPHFHTPEVLARLIFRAFLAYG